MRHRHWVAIGALAVASLAACKKEREPYVPGSAAKVLSVQMADLRPAIAARLDSGNAPSWVPKDEWKRVKGIYASYQNAPLWLEADGVKDRGNALLQAIEAAPAQGLSTAAYPLDSIRAVVGSDRLTEKASAQALADADVLLTAAFVAYASDMLVGQIDPKTISQAWYIPAQKREVDSALVKALTSPAMAEALAQMAPQDSGYAVLVSEYARYQKLAASGGWSAIPTGTALKPGAKTSTARLEALRQRLAVEGFIGSVKQSGQSGPQNAAAAGKYDGEMVAAVKAFQEQHNLDTTGIVGSATIQALNGPVEDRVKQIASNLERYRWMPRSLGQRYILVNVPAFRLDAYDSGQKKLEMKVVVGAEYQGRSTPVFSDSMEFVVFRPYWNVTDNIAAKEIFPKVAADPGYLDRGNYEIYSDHGTRRVRQKPGDGNALGLVKFMFPNDFNIYLHDTPQKALFEKSDRAASHGCIRLEKPDEMAQFVLGWSADRVHEAMNSGGNNRTVNLPKKIPVYIVYLTAYAQDGKLHFADDLYGRDDALESQIADSASAADTSNRH